MSASAAALCTASLAAHKDLTSTHQGVQEASRVAHEALAAANAAMGARSSATGSHTLQAQELAGARDEAARVVSETATGIKVLRDKLMGIKREQERLCEGIGSVHGLQEALARSNEACHEVRIV